MPGGCGKWPIGDVARRSGGVYDCRMVKNMPRAMRPPVGWLLAALWLLAACQVEGGITDPSVDGQVVDGLALTAAAEGLTLRVTLRNTTTNAITISYPAGCPVRIRLYRLLDGARVYDEARLACGAPELVPFRIDARASRALHSGWRTVCFVRGDSLPVGEYRAAAIVQLVGDAPVEVEAGPYFLGEFPGNGCS